MPIPFLFCEVYGIMSIDMIPRRSEANCASLFYYDCGAMTNF